MLEAAGEQGTGARQEPARAGGRRSPVGHSGSEAGSCVVQGIRRNLTKSLTRGMGFRLRMSGMLSIMISPPPGLQERRESAGKGKLRQEGPPCYCPMFTWDLVDRTAEQPSGGLGPTRGTPIPTTTLAMAGITRLKTGRGFWQKTVIFPT